MVSRAAVFPSEWQHRQFSTSPRLRGRTQRHLRAPAAQAKRRKALSRCVRNTGSFPLPLLLRFFFLFSRTIIAPKPVTRHLVVTARPPEPTRPGPGDGVSDPATFQNPPREAYPDEVLTHRFRPYGD